MSMVTHVPGALKTAKNVGGGMLFSGVVGKTAIGAGIGGAVGAYDASQYDSPTLQAGAIGRGALFGALALGGATALWKGNMALGRSRYLRKTGMGSAVKETEGIRPALRSTAGQEGLTFSQRVNRKIAWLGGATGEGIIDAKSFAHSPLARAAGGFAGAVGGAAWGTVKRTPVMAGFAARHPGVIAGAAALGTAGYFGGSMVTGPSASPTLSGATVNTNYAQQEGGISALQRSNIVPMNMGTYPTMMGPMQRAFQNSTEGLTQGLHRGRHG